MKNLMIAALSARVLMMYLFTEYHGAAEATFLFCLLTVLVLIGVLAIDEKLAELKKVQ